MRNAATGQLAGRTASTSLLRHSAKQTGGVVSMIRRGVPVALVERLASKLDLPRTKLFALLGVAERTMPRRLSTGLLKPMESDRFYRLDRVVALAEEAIGDAEKAREWLKRPNRTLTGETPFEHLDTEAGAQDVENLLQQIKHGLFV
jgi:putative toxin-antitoxin system antitoxin component (TIGR02293 family)